jgi:Survival motor neuron (SMN) interacting protein 1 (SIP1)
MGVSVDIRSEAKGVPSLLVAPKAPENEDDDIYNSGRGDSRGFYSDGAFTAAPVLGPAFPVTGGIHTSERTSMGPQEAFYTTILHRYRALRSRIRSPLPALCTIPLDADHPTTLPANSRPAFSHWRRFLQITTPHPAQLAQMDFASALRLIRILMNLLKKNRDIPKNMSAWTWALLARVEEVGAMGSEEVGVLRELGKRAVWILASIKQSKDDQRALMEAGGYDDEDDEEEDVALDWEVEGGLDLEETGTVLSIPELAVVQQSASEDGEILDDAVPDASESLEAAKARLLSRMAEEEGYPEPPAIDEKSEKRVLEVNNNTQTEDVAAIEAEIQASKDHEAIEDEDEEYPSQNTLATLCCILTIIGEEYGQRDLLEYRMAGWE